MIKVFKLDDYDWWAGESLEEVITEARNKCGQECYEDAETEAYELSEEAMKTHKFVDQYDEGYEYITFEEQLQKMIDNGESFPCLFATTVA